MPAGSRPTPTIRASDPRWAAAAVAVAALAFGAAWQVLAACDAAALILLLHQLTGMRPSVSVLLHAAPAARLPKLSLHLAVRNAPPDRLGRTLEALARLDYPDLEVLVVDSNTADPACWASAARHCARLGARFRFFALGPWPGGRAGALAFARVEMAPDAELIGVLRDGDLPEADWLRCAAAGFADARLGAVTASFRGGAGDGVWALLVRTVALDQAGGWVPGFDAMTAELMLRLSGCGWQVSRAERAAGHTERDRDDPARAPYRFGEMLRSHLRQLLSGHSGVAVPALSAAIWLADALHVPAFALCLLWSAALAGFSGSIGFPPPPVLVPLLALAALRVALAACRPAASLLALADLYRSGLAVWYGLLNIGRMPPGIPREARLALLALAAIGAAALHRPGGIAEAMWFLFVLTLALPDLAALRARPALHQPRHLAAHTGTGD